MLKKDIILESIIIKDKEDLKNTTILLEWKNQML